MLVAQPDHRAVEIEGLNDLPERAGDGLLEPIRRQVDEISGNLADQRLEYQPILEAKSRRLFGGPLRRDIDDRHEDKGSGLDPDWSEPHLNRELRPVLASSEQKSADAHLAGYRLVHVRQAQRRVAGPLRRGYDRVDRLSGQRLRRIAEVVLGYQVGEEDYSLIVHDDHADRGGVDNQRNQRIEVDGGAGQPAELVTCWHPGTRSSYPASVTPV